MNKAFVREPEPDGRGYCPKCAALGAPVTSETLDRYVRPESRPKIHDAAWFCGYARCEVGYFNQYGAVVSIDELTQPVYPKDLDAPICACFGLTYDDVAADVREPTPARIRALLARSQSPDATCALTAANAKCCIPAVQELYFRLRARAAPS